MHSTDTPTPRPLRWVTAAGGALLVLVAAVAVLGGPLRNDRLVTRFVVGHRTDWVTDVAKVISTVFSPVTTVVFAVVIAVVFMYRDRSVRRAVALLAGVCGAAAVAELLKLLVERRRPPFAVQMETHEAAQSFPSGHVTGTTALVVGVALLAVPSATRGLRAAMLSAAAAVALASAVSRVYLGMHWTSDVIAGMLLGAAAALAAPVIVDRLDRVVDPIDTRLFRRGTASA
ncbi:phosphatase PAP2 family protein [Gordonia sp. PDNC005]|uniref:phosphatase PAP2 family protein n=1 Tax=unclassified Gordonia (in: high G+C Gram-positive bacteria) TaxID=2657482 RepID=UPI001965915C|nr:phosphatase PAP2 family protein [Gordonia sp. PDNC005]QRY64172.1 phosphatase PAP2 family protein [Gordonia sp. PDNC005]